MSLVSFSNFQRAQVEGHSTREYWREMVTFDLYLSSVQVETRSVMAMQAERTSQDQEEDQFGPQLISRLEVSRLV